MGGIRVGLLGGTFDPPHLGHLWLAESARNQLHLDQVLFLPVGEPPHKPGNGVTAVTHRLSMTQLAIADHPAFYLDTTDSYRPPPHTTATLLPLIHAAQPEAELWLLLGSDSLRDFPTWFAPGQIIAHCRLAALARPGVVVDWAALETAVPGLRAATDMLVGPTVDISATAVRQWARQNHSLRYLVPTPVLDYIQQQTLYHQPQAQR
ncbi:MAG: nicotinate (nicotinamide) nucleotide adenylyltransferase [Chloroflexi bacterium]|nr:nicotinate (nicotinamide) nucleotide adenylyltransferase [Chloroflexota bacterium]